MKTSWLGWGALSITLVVLASIGSSNANTINPVRLNSAVADNPASCVVTNGKIRPGTYTGTSPITRVVDRNRQINPKLTAHDHVNENATVTMSVVVDKDGTVHGSWKYHSSVSDSVSIVETGQVAGSHNYQFDVQDGQIVGTGTMLRMNGGASSVSPIVIITNGYVNFPTSPLLNHVIDNPLTVDPTSCDTLALGLRYPFTGLTLVDFAAPPAQPAVLFGSAPQRWSGTWTPPPCDEEPQVTIQDKPTDYPVSSFNDFLAAALSKNPVGYTSDISGAHLLPDPKTGTVLLANLFMNATITRPTWRQGTPPPSAADTNLLNKTVEIIRTHENMHAENARMVAKKYTCLVHDKATKEAATLIHDTMICELAKANRALDARAGKLVPVRDSNQKIIDVQYVPETNLPALPQGCT